MGKHDHRNKAPQPHSGLLIVNTYLSHKTLQCTYCAPGTGKGAREGRGYPSSVGVSGHQGLSQNCPEVEDPGPFL